MEDKIQKMRQQNFEAYQDYVMGKNNNYQSNNSFIEAAEKELEKLNEAVQELETSYSKMENERQNENGREEFAELSKEMIDRYIKKIIVYSEQKIEICWKEM